MKTKLQLLALSLGLSVSGISLLGSNTAQAASDTWTGTTSGTWSVTTNWSGGSAPGSGNTATFNGASSNTTIGLGAGVTIGTVVFDTASAAAYTIGSGAVGSQTLTLGAAVTMNASVVNDQLFNANVALSADATFTNNSAKLLTLAGAVTGGRKLTKSGTGTLVISGAGTNTFSNYQFSGGLTKFTSGTSNFTATQGDSALNNGGSVEVGSGATVNVSDNSHGNNVWLAIGDTAGQTSTFTVNGGNVTLSSSWGVQVGRNGNGTLTINSGTFSTNDPNNKGIEMGESAGSQSIVNLNGGTLAANRIYNGANTASAFYFNGGTLKALDSRTNFFNNTANIATQVRNGGGIIDTNGFNITFNEAIEHSTVGGDNATDGGLTKQGAGTLTLTGSSTYTGATTISNGTLVTGSGGSVNSSSGITVNGSGAKLLQVNTATAISPTVTLTQGTVDGTGTINTVNVGNGTGGILSNGNGGTTALTIGTLTFSGTATTNLNLADTSAGIVVTGTLTTAGSNSVTLNATNSGGWANGTTYNLISYGSFSGALGNFVKGTVPGLGARQSAILGDSGSAITLAIDGDTPFWTGAESNVWTTGTIGGSSNWRLVTGATPTDFLTNDIVLFNDDASRTDVNIAENVSPVSTTIEGYNDFTFSGTGGIAGGSLTKNGSGTVIFSTTNTYTGATTINGGTLQLGDGTTDGAIPNSAITNNANLTYNLVGSQTQGTVISGAGSVTKDGTGTLVLTASNTYGGATTINSGTLQLGTGSAGSIGSTSSITNNGTLVFNSTDAVNYTQVISGSGSVSVNGGITQLVGANTYTGNTTLNSGTLTVGGTANTALGSGTLNLNAGTLTSTNNGNTNFDPAVSNTIVSGGGNIAGGQWTLFHIKGNITGSAALGLSAIFGGSGLRLEGDNSGYNGTATVTGANVRLAAATAGSALAAWVVNGNLQTDVVGGATFNLGSLGGSGNISGHANNGSAAVSTLSVGALNTSGTFSGTIIDNAQDNAATGNADGAQNNVLALTKVGSGRLTLNGANTYTGATTIAGGTLAVGATGSISNSSTIDVQASTTLDVSAVTGFTVGASQTLKGSGTVIGNVTVNGTVAPGASPGTLSVIGDFNLTSTAVLGFELQSGDVTIGGIVNDLIDVFGNLTLDGTLNVTELGGSLVNGSTYRLFNYTGGTLTNNTLDISTAFLALHPGSSIDTATAGQVNLLVVPEPGTFAMLLGGVGMLTLFRRRRA